jgi:uncharacterized phage-associated protein
VNHLVRVVISSYIDVSAHLFRLRNAGGITVSQALSVAKELFELSFAGDEPDPLTNLRLQKLLYYAQAWSLIIRESELFPEDLEAWRHGPVVPAVYRTFPDGQGAKYITPEIFETVPNLHPMIAEFVERVWESYKQHSALQLSKMTHEESPWRKAWGERTKDDIGNDPILMEDLEAYFASQSVPGPLAEYEHRRRKQEEEAERVLAELPPLDADCLRKMSKSHSPSVALPNTGG